MKGLWWVLNYSPVAAGSLLNDSLHEISWRRVWPAVLRWSQRGGNEENQHDREQNSVLSPDTMTKPTALMWQHVLRPIYQHLHLCKEYTLGCKVYQLENISNACRESIHLSRNAIDQRCHQTAQGSLPPLKAECSLAQRVKINQSLPSAQRHLCAWKRLP